MTNVMKFGVLTVSDSCYKNENVNQSGPKLVSLIKSQFSNSVILYEDVVPDELAMVRDKLLLWSETDCDVIFTTGGTGFAPRDITPEATRSVIEREAPGITIAIHSKSLESTLFAMLSRAVCGIRKKTLIINFPGSLKAVVENFDIVKDIIPHAVSLIKDDMPRVKETHQHVQHTIPKQLTPSKVKLDAVAARNRVSPYPTVEVNVAHDIIMSVCVQTSETDNANINDALNRVLAEDVRSYEPLPPFPASIKDGYAVKSADGAGKRIVNNMVAAGDSPVGGVSVASGECVRVSTGAAVPGGADAVVQLEDTDLLLAPNDSSRELEINIKVAPTPGQDIRKVGSDIEAHSVVLKKGSVLNAAELGVLAAVGKMQVKVFKRLSIGIISTGNELQNPEEPLRPGHIRDTNKITLLNLLQQYGYKADDCGKARDEPTVLKHAFEKAFETSDLVITTGGVSMGEYDLVKQVLVQDFDARINFGRVNMKPGKPTTFATCLYNGKVKLIFGLPGNPVSATVSCLLFVIPTLRHCENRSDKFFPLVQVEAQFMPFTDKERPDYQRVRLGYEGTIIKAFSTGNQISSRLNSFAGADGLMLVPPICQKPEEATTSKIFGRHGNCKEAFAFGKKTEGAVMFGDFSNKPKYWCYLLGKI